MAQLAGTTDTYDLKGQREDLHEQDLHDYP